MFPLTIPPFSPARFSLLRRITLITMLAAAAMASPATAAEATGSVEGRIQNIATGDYLDSARVTIEGTNLVTLTNQFGEYRITGLPAGPARVTAFYSGRPYAGGWKPAAPPGTAGRDACRNGPVAISRFEF